MFLIGQCCHSNINTTKTTSYQIQSVLRGWFSPWWKLSRSFSNLITAQIVNFGSEANCSMVRLEGILLLTSEQGTLLYAKEISKWFGLSSDLGGNELQLCAILYTLFISSCSINDKLTVGESSLRWIKSVCSLPVRVSTYHCIMPLFKYRKNLLFIFSEAPMLW